MQWLWHINFNQEIKDMFSMLNIIGIRSLDQINFLDENYKKQKSFDAGQIVSSIDGLKDFKDFWKDLEKSEDFKKIQFVEFLRK